MIATEPDQDRPKWFPYINNKKESIGDGSTTDLPKKKYYDMIISDKKDNEIEELTSKLPRKLQQQNVETFFLKKFKDPRFYNPANVQNPVNTNLLGSLLMNIGVSPPKSLNTFFGLTSGMIETNFIDRSYNSYQSQQAQAPATKKGGSSVTEKPKSRQKHKKTKKLLGVANR
jgi:hypothetical protein